MKTNDQKITPFLWFNTQAEEAVEFYISIFKSGEIQRVSRYGKEGYEHHRMPEGSAMAVDFELEGQRFSALNGGPAFPFNPSVSFYITCETEKEADQLWKSLSENGSILMPYEKYDWSEKYGWLQDRFGLSWQVSLGKIKDVGQKITPSLLFVGERFGQAKQAVERYTQIFKHSKVDGILMNEPTKLQSKTSVMHAQFALNGYKFMAMDSDLAHDFTFNEAVSFMVHCEDQSEIDYYWSELGKGGDPKAQQCGWLKDEFGISWQIIPNVLGQLMTHKDTEKVKRVTRAMLQMKKINIKGLEEA
ncbi:VOC family protein [Marivirga sp. S37H4]|uniref:VOC family protein n=1 Tax=Marivirga aurantiaca TaxID=2802615 RepID=A0A934X1H1_9BACT|nr:VOC family protein [Marivirga aurantiaca]MBK6266585.1 VOC family protein [Marivirga aurantiaca]